MRKLLWLFLTIPLSAQVYYTLPKTTALSSAAEVLTVQQPANGVSRRIRFISAYIDCSVACTVTLERNGTAASSTIQVPAQVNPQLSTPALAQGFNSSNVGTGTVLSKVSLAANGSVIVDLSNITMVGADSSQNFTVRTSSISGTVDIMISWSEL